MKPKQNVLLPTVRPAGSARLLTKWRAWFDDGGDDRDGQDQQDGDDQDSGGKYNPADLDEALRIIEALEKRIGERDAQLDQYNKRLTAIEADRKKKLEDEGNYKALLDQTTAELESLRLQAQRAESLEGVIRAGNEEMIRRIPEDRRKMVTKLAEQLSPEALRAWLDENLPLLTKQPPPDYDAGAGGNGGTGGKPGEESVQVTDADREKARIASAYGHQIKPEDVAKARIEMERNRAGNRNQT